MSDVARVDDADQALHRDHEASMSVTVGAGILVDLVERRQVFVELFRVMGERFPDAARLDRQWRGVLADEALRHASRSVDRGTFDEKSFAALRQFATETATDSAIPDRWRRLHERQRQRPGAAAAALRVTRQRLREEAAYLRWARIGI
jgi:hypothetical protein